MDTITFSSKSEALAYWQTQAFTARYFGETEAQAAARKLDAFVQIRIVCHGK